MARAYCLAEARALVAHRDVVFALKRWKPLHSIPALTQFGKLISPQTTIYTYQPHRVTSTMKRSLASILTSFFFVSSIVAADSPSHTLWYQQPAENWQTEALPIGNGKLGAMVFGQVERERVMFNEDSLWIGDEWDTGAYQAFGDVYFNLHPESFRIDPSSSTHPNKGVEGLNQAFDSNPKSKWAFEHKNKTIIADITVKGEATPLTEYTLVSANDVPARDPSNWKLLASNDTKSWTIIDQQRNEPQWQNRHQAKSFKVRNNKSWRHYRFVFEPSKTVPHFQVAEIKLNVEPTGGSTFSNYTRKLDIQNAVHTTSYTLNGVSYTREAFSSAPAGV
jgi:alpha-L-fucosidase 2